MLIKNVAEHQLYKALDVANEKFDGNLRFKRIERAGFTRAGREDWNVTLTVSSSKGKGARIGFSGRRIAAACWHAHGAFMDNLPENAVIVVSGGRDGKMTLYPGSPWVDRNIGSMMQPLYYSDACECER